MPYGFTQHRLNLCSTFNLIPPTPAPRTHTRTQLKFGGDTITLLCQDLF